MSLEYIQPPEASQFVVPEGNGVDLEMVAVAQHLFVMPREQRRALRGLLEGRVAMNPCAAEELVDNAKEVTATRSRCVGLSLTQYVEAYDALRSGDRQRINILAQDARAVIESQKTERQDTFLATPQFTHSERIAHQKKVIDRHLQQVPATKEKIVTGVGGMMGSGKTEVTPVGSGRAVQIDIDELRKELLHEYDETSQHTIDMVMQDSWVLADRLASESIKANRSVTFQSTFHRSRWLRDRFLKDAVERYHYKPQFIYVHRPAFDCFRRAVGFRSRPVPVDRLLDGLEGYYNVPKIVEKYDAQLIVVDFTSPSFGVQVSTNYVGREAFAHLVEFANRRNDIAEVIKVYSDIPVV